MVVCFSRELAETSPYMEAMKKKDIEVLYCFEPYDELVLMNLGQFDKKTLKSIENEMAVEDKSGEEMTGGEKHCLLGGRGTEYRPSDAWW